MLAQCPSNTVVYLRDGSAQTVARAATQRQKLQITIIIIIIIIINLIYITEFDTNGILTALYIVITYIQMQYVHV